MTARFASRRPDRAPCGTRLNSSITYGTNATSPAASASASVSRSNTNGSGSIHRRARTPGSFPLVRMGESGQRPEELHGSSDRADRDLRIRGCQPDRPAARHRDVPAVLGTQLHRSLGA